MDSNQFVPSDENQSKNFQPSCPPYHQVFQPMPQQNIQVFQSNNTYQPLYPQIQPVILPMPQPTFPLESHNTQIIQPSHINVNLTPVATSNTTSVFVKKNDYLCWSILNLFCCFFLGVVAVIMSAQVIELNNTLSKSASAKSRMVFRINLATTIIGLFFIIYVPYYKTH